ncbi:hypothetical protein JQS43_16630 [Natronosporangium hydrolyticum]|uniref:Chromosome segregation ATPase n=1 Tax=Natronosporangium hydrolyticum TaxID=2811111 RepID=A0A895YHP3_9ACTN|nr:hypothetical protein [Natronosporangium hydrolyticum]QSB13248.1 hypothetical protein JQS43_16630 [Natronosporangium hydrolyticum]
MPASATQSAEGEEPYDIVGNRVLIGVQMVNISRLSTHPVPITTRGLITVAGQGPTDSNGAGKSSFIAGLSLLHADDQWRLQSGAQAAAELLFTAELAGHESMHANADRGYLIGVFAPPEVEDPADLADAVLTIWLRINRQSPHLELRWANRLHLAYGETENERAAGADQLWEALPRSNGRTDLRANRLSRTLYGETVRCVSFLSTSVRASLTANLLAQPLNELTPERIFDAIGALTGLTGEVEQEQKARAEEHRQATDAERAREDFESWGARMSTVEAGIQARERARSALDEAQQRWRSRCARWLVDGVAETENLAADQAMLEQTIAGLDEQIAALGTELARLTDDETFQRSCQQRIDAYHQLKSQEENLTTTVNQALGSIEPLRTQQRRLMTQAEEADGLTLDEATAAVAKADQAVDEAQQAKGIAAAAHTDAKRRLAAAERGEDIAAAQVHRLRSAEILAAPLVDVVTLTDAQRSVWEARLLPYRAAVVVPAEAAARAGELLADQPGSLLVHADPAGHRPTGPACDLPGSAEPELPLHRFLTALADRAGAEPSAVDTVAGVAAVSGFPEPVTGRTGRIQQAQAALDTAAQAAQLADDDLAAAQAGRDRARRRQAAAEAGWQAENLAEQIEQIRAEVERQQDELRQLAGPLATAQHDFDEAKAEQRSRDGQLAHVKERRAALEREAQAATLRWRDNAIRRDDLDLPARHTAWGGTVAEAEQHLLQLSEREQTQPLSEWDELAETLSDSARHACFPPGTPAEELPEELRLLDEQRRSRRGADRISLIPTLLRILGTYLEQYAQVDQQQQTEITRQRAEKAATLHSAESHLAEAQQATQALRGTIASAIKAKLKQVSQEFDRIDKAYGGYGGALDYPEPEPPADPEKPWRWSVTPKWRRGEGKPLSSYRLRGNTAQMDDKAVKLVCAAALAGSADRPLLLVLDELGRNLGAAHRRDAVALFENIGRDRAISVVGALQDDMERYAVGASSLYIKLRRTSDTLPYNQAPVVVGSETNQGRVALLSQWLASYRPEPLP